MARLKDLAGSPPGHGSNTAKEASADCVSEDELTEWLAASMWFTRRALLDSTMQAPGNSATASGLDDEHRSAAFPTLTVPFSG